MTKITKQLAGIQDLLLGSEEVEQERAGQTVTITGVSAQTIPFDEAEGPSIAAQLGTGVTTIKGTWEPQVTGGGFPLVNKFDLDSESSAELLVEGAKVTTVSGEAPSGMATNADVFFPEKSALYFKISAKGKVDELRCGYIGLANSVAFDESITAFLRAGLTWRAKSRVGEVVKPAGVTLEGLGNMLNEDNYKGGDFIPMSQAEFMAKTWALCYDSSSRGDYGRVFIYDTDINGMRLSYPLQKAYGNPLCAVMVTPSAWADGNLASGSVEIIHEPANPIAGFTTLKIGEGVEPIFDGVTANNAYTIVGETGAAAGLHDGDIAFINEDGDGIQRVLKRPGDSCSCSSSTIKGTWTPQVTYGEGYPLVNKFDMDSESSAELLVEGTKVTMVSGEAPSGVATDATVIFPTKSALYYKASVLAPVDDITTAYTALANGTRFDENFTGAIGSGLMWVAEYEDEEVVEPEGVYIQSLGNVMSEDNANVGHVLSITQEQFSSKVWALCYDSSVGTYGEVSVYDTDTPDTPLASHLLQSPIDPPLCAVMVTPYAWAEEGIVPSSVEIIHEPDSPIAGFTTLKIGAEAVLSFDGVSANNAYTIVGETGAEFGLHDGDIAFINEDGDGVQQVLKSSEDVDLSSYVKKSELADVAFSGKAADIDNSEGTFAEPSDLADFLTKTDWSAMSTLSSADNVLTLTKGVYKAYSNNPPQNFPPVAAEVGIPVLVVVHADPYYDSYLGRNVEFISIYADDIWQRTIEAVAKWVKIYPTEPEEISAEQVKLLYESNPNTNAFTDANVNKLANAADKTLPINWVVVTTPTFLIEPEHAGMSLWVTADCVITVSYYNTLPTGFNCEILKADSSLNVSVVALGSDTIRDGISVIESDASLFKSTTFGVFGIIEYAQGVNGIDDAPSDGKTYARKDGTWVEVDKPQAQEVLTANKTLTAADNKKILLISADGLTITLPTAAPNFSVDIVKMDEEFITLVQTNGTDKFREDTTTITVVKDATIFSTEVVGKEYVAIGAYEA